uniref:Cytochrome P450 n=1 Tax=Zooxanthella nutricula TaxID=1333877 RepID=A0A7S2P8W3_9DINO
MASELSAASSASATSSRADLLSVLIGEQTIDDTQISRILFDIIIAGSDTTASTLSAALYVLHEPRHRAEQLALARAEAIQVDAASVSFDDIKTALPYTTAVAREILRLYPPVPFFGRTSVADATVCGYAIKNGSTACFSPWYMGRDEYAWGATVEDFDPGRWLRHPSTGGAPSSFQWLPFGAGARGCIGTRLALTEAILGLARLLREFDFAFARDGELEFTYDITLNLEGSTICTITPRAAETTAAEEDAKEGQFVSA